MEIEIEFRPRQVGMIVQYNLSDWLLHKSLEFESNRALDGEHVEMFIDWTRRYSWVVESVDLFFKAARILQSERLNSSIELRIVPRRACARHFFSNPPDWPEILRVLDDSLEFPPVLRVFHQKFDLDFGDNTYRPLSFDGLDLPSEVDTSLFRSSVVVHKNKKPTTYGELAFVLTYNSFYF